MLLALETANDQCSVVLYDHTGVRAQRWDGQSREQTRLLLPMIEAVMHEVDIGFTGLTAIAFSRGPGSFSGIRINAAVTQALAWTHDLPVIPVSTLQATAQHAADTLDINHMTVALDARMNELYIGAFARQADGIMIASGEEQLVAYDQVFFAPALPTHILVGSGSDLVQCPDDQGISIQRHPTIPATATDIAKLGWHALANQRTVCAADALPVYLRDNAWKTLEEQRAAAVIKAAAHHEYDC